LTGTLVLEGEVVDGTDVKRPPPVFRRGVVDPDPAGAVGIDGAGNHADRLRVRGGQRVIPLFTVVVIIPDGPALEIPHHVASPVDRQRGRRARREPLPVRLRGG